MCYTHIFRKSASGCNRERFLLFGSLLRITHNGQKEKTNIPFYTGEGVNPPMWIVVVLLIGVSWLTGFAVGYVCGENEPPTEKELNGIKRRKL